MKKTTEVVRGCEYPDDSSIYLRYKSSTSFFSCGVDFAFSKLEQYDGNKTDDVNEKIKKTYIQT
jgi:hypothetical protein